MRTIGSLSSGERQSLAGLLALASAESRAVIKLVVLDEPFAHLDPEHQAIQMARLQRLCRAPNAPAVLVISHGHVETLLSMIPGSERLHLKTAAR